MTEDPRPLRLLRDGVPLPEVSDSRASASDIVGEVRDAPFRFDTMDPKALQNVLGSMAGMAQAQVQRFKAAGCMVLLFDSTGTMVSAFERPEDGVTDGYAVEMLRQYIAENAGPAPKPKRKKPR